MKNNIILILLICLSTLSSNAMEYSELNSVKPPAYRLGITDEIEQKIDVAPIEKKNTRDINATDSIDRLTFADVSIKRISADISQDLMIDEDVMKKHLSLLWQGAATKSDIIKYTLYKLSNPDKDKPNEKSIKKVLQSVANMSTLLGAGTGNSILSASSFLSGNILGIFAHDDKDVNYRYTKVNDADMIVLVRKVNDLQQKVVNKYYNYISARELVKMSAQNVKKSHDNYIKAQNSTKEIILITDAYYRQALDTQMKFNLDFQAVRSSLEELVGKETLLEFEELLKNEDE